MPQPHTDPEFVSCCLVAREHGLNPLTKEIYFMRDKHGKIQAIVGVDGWIKKCNEHPQFDGIEFAETMNVDGNKITAIKCRIFRKDRSRPIETTEYMAECVQTRDKKGPWDSHPSRMLRHRSLIQCARIAFGFAGIMDRDEFDQWQSMRDVTPKSPQVTRDPENTLPEIPDLPDIPDETLPDTQDIEVEPIKDVNGFLEHLEAQVRDCESDSELAELKDSSQEMIARLPAKAQKTAEKILSGEAE